MKKEIKAWAVMMDEQIASVGTVERIVKEVAETMKRNVPPETGIVFTIVPVTITYQVPKKIRK